MHFHRAIERSAMDVNSSVVLGIIPLDYNADIHGAEECFRRAIQIQPTNIIARQKIAIIIALHSSQGDHDEVYINSNPLDTQERLLPKKI
jgi:hypothetical protein